MRNCWKLLLLPLLFAACSESEEPAPETPKQQVTVTLSSPEAGVYDPSNPLTIAGDAELNVGAVEKVRLSLNGEVLPSVQEVPFSYTHHFDADFAGEVLIKLQVEGDRGATGMATRTITVQKPVEPKPEEPKPDDPKPEEPTLPTQTPEGYPLVIVAQDGSGHYTKVQAAINSIPSDNRTRVVYIKAGTYKEKLIIGSGHNNLIMVGEDAATTILTYDDSAGTLDSEGAKLGTHSSASVAVKSSDFMAVNLTFENTFVNYAGGSDTQAVAYRQDADCATFYNCRFVGYQDTLYLKNASRCYFYECYIEGNVDFIFGDSVAYFEQCQLHCNRNESVLTAAATLEESKFGFVFESCRITHIEGQDFNGKQFSFFHLGRPWKNKPKTVFLRCEEPAALSAAGWRSMSVEADLYAEYRCTGPGAAEERLAQREMGGRQLTDAEALAYTKLNIFAADTNPTKYSSSWIPPQKYTYVLTE